MSKTRKTLASTYKYDPLNRLSATKNLQRFYNDTRIATEIEGERKTCFFEADSQPLAMQQHGSDLGNTLWATDQQSSVLIGISADGSQHVQMFTPFGHHAKDALISVMGFNGERPEPVTGHYVLGQGYRAFNPVLMRFNSPDSWSPFGEGGVNAYAYCENEPVMRQDPTGHFFGFIRRGFKGTLNLIGARNPGSAKAAKPVFTNTAEPDLANTAKSVFTNTAKPLIPDNSTEEQRRLQANNAKEFVHAVVTSKDQNNHNRGRRHNIARQNGSSANLTDTRRPRTNSPSEVIPSTSTTSGLGQPRSRTFDIVDEAGIIRTWDISN